MRGPRAGFSWPLEYPTTVLLGRGGGAYTLSWEEDWQTREGGNTEAFPHRNRQCGDRPQGMAGLHGRAGGPRILSTPLPFIVMGGKSERGVDPPLSPLKIGHLRMQAWGVGVCSRRQAHRGGEKGGGAGDAYNRGQSTYRNLRGKTTVVVVVIINVQCVWRVETRMFSGQTESEIKIKPGPQRRQRPTRPWPWSWFLIHGCIDSRTLLCPH